MFCNRYAVPIVTGLTVLGAVTAFAAGFNVTSDTVLSGNADVPSCNNSATVKYQTVYDDQVPGYKVATASRHDRFGLQRHELSRIPHRRRQGLTRRADGCAHV